MAFNAAFLQSGAAAQAAAFPFVSLHTAQPNATGSNESLAARKNAGWTSANGVLALGAPVDFTGGAASGPVTHVGVWSAATGGTFGGWYAISGDQAFNAAGQYRLNTFPVTNSAS